MGSRKEIWGSGAGRLELAVPDGDVCQLIEEVVGKEGAAAGGFDAGAGKDGFGDDLVVQQDGLPEMQDRSVIGVEHRTAGDREGVAFFQRANELERIPRKDHVDAGVRLLFEVEAEDLADKVVAAILHIERIIQAVHDVLDVDVLLFYGICFRVLHVD